MTSRADLNYVRYARNCWQLADKHGRLVSLRPNRAQMRVLRAMAAQRERGRPIRVRVLKYRQAGISVLATSLALHWCMTRTGQTAISLADKSDLPAQWLRRCRAWHQQTPIGLRPHAGATNANELWLDNLQSRYYIGSAEGTTPGMGATIQFVHCSEVASWRSASAIMDDLSPAIPPGGNTLVLQESTGRSVGDWWYQRYWSAKRGDEDYAAVFLPWYLQDEYRMDAGEIRGLSEDERALRAASVDDQQLAWRRWMIRTEFRGSVEEFANQYPATEHEAFLAAGRNVFTQEMVAQARRNIRQPRWRGEIVPKGDCSEFELISSDGGRLVVWDKPREGQHYAIGADCQWSGRDEADYDVAYVEDVTRQEVVAQWYGRAGMGDYARILASLGHMYNTATLAPERNSRAAEGVIMPLCGLAGNSWRYPNLYVRSKLAPYGAPKPTDYGWYTDEHTKPQLVVRFQRSLQAGLADCPDEGLCSEIEAYIVDDHNRMTAPEGLHDDRLMARMITHAVAAQVRTELPGPDSDWGDLSDWQHRYLDHLEEIGELESA